jgi:uncharacterized membrane protein YeiH
MDIGGIALVAAVSSLMGGTFRNLFLLKEPPWILNPWLLSPAVAAVLLTVVTKKVESTGRLLLALDTFGLAVATVSSAEFGFRAGVTYVVAIVLAIIGAVTGGLLRDVLAQVPPVLLHRETIGTSCLAGAVALSLLRLCHVNNVISLFVGGFVVIAIRELSIWREWNLPKVGGN